MLTAQKWGKNGVYFLKLGIVTKRCVFLDNDGDTVLFAIWLHGDCHNLDASTN